MLKLFRLPLLVSLPVIINIIRPNVAAALSSSDVSNNLDVGSPPKVDEGYMGELLWVLFVLGFVIVLLYFTVKFIANKNKSFLSPKGIKSLGGIGVGANSSVQVLQIADRIYIVGVGQQVTLLDKEIDPEVVKEIIESFTATKQANMVSIKDWLSALRQNKQNKETDINDLDWNQSNTNSFETLLQSKLDKQAERKQQLESLLKDNKE